MPVSVNEHEYACLHTHTIFCDGYDGTGYWSLDYDSVEGNDECFPKGYEAAFDYLKTKTPEGQTFSYVKKDKHYIITVKVDFTSIDDLNKKYKAASGVNYDAKYDVKMSTNTISDDEFDMTINMPYLFSRGLLSWMSQEIIRSNDIFIPATSINEETGEVTIITTWENMFGVFDVKLIVGNNEKQFYDIFEEGNYPDGYNQSPEVLRLTGRFGISDKPSIWAESQINEAIKLNL